MRMQCSFLSDSEKQRIHEDTLKILSTVGVRFMSPKALKLLADNGAAIDRENMIARIPPAMVNQALKTAPKSFVLGARNPAFNFNLPSTYTGYTLDGAATFAIHRREEIPYLIEGLAAILGSEAEIKKRKIFSVCYCTIPPLTHDAEMCEACLDLVKYHIPILPYPMPACGSTGPASLYSDIAVANAEGLSALVLFQTADPGTPIIYGNAAGIMNFNSGAFLEGAPESTLINGSLGEMARFYDLPGTQAGCLTDAKSPGPQAIMEKMTSAIKVEEILAAPQKNPLPDKIIGKLEDIMRRADQELS